MKAALTAERLREVLHYDPETGVFTRKVKRVWNASGSEEATPTHGYLKLGVDGVQYMAHRLAWLHVYGHWPREFIDHINGNRSDNRIANLRDASCRTNNENKRGPRADNVSSGVLGVHWSEYHKKWKAHIRVDGRLKHLKYCRSIDEAHAVYLAAKRKLHAGCTI